MDRENLAQAITGLKTNLVFCQQCHNLAENILCAICANPDRQQNIICVVEEPLDVVALEQGRAFKGTYHVLGGVISPIDGIGPDDLKISELIERIKGFGSISPSAPSGAEGIREDDLSSEASEKEEKGVEIIIATNPSLEGEGTALYLAKRLKHFPNLKITRIAHGLPIGGDIEYADELTIMKALEGRRDYRING